MPDCRPLQYWPDPAGGATLNLTNGIVNLPDLSRLFTPRLEQNYGRLLYQVELKSKKLTSEVTELQEANPPTFCCNWTRPSPVSHMVLPTPLSTMPAVLDWLNRGGANTWLGVWPLR